MKRLHRAIFGAVTRYKRAVSEVLFVAGTLGFVLAVTRIIGQGEPYQTYVLSWAAIAVTGFLTLEVSD